MGVVVRWPQHIRQRCRCGEGTCWHCGGGLFMCKTCGGAEGSVPTDCPGERMDEATENQVYAGQLNFIRGPGWVRVGDRQFKANY